MASSLISGKYVVCGVLDGTEAVVITDASVFQRDGRIVEIGDTNTLRAKYKPDEVIGSSENVVLPGLINSHHHTGLTPFQT